MSLTAANPGGWSLNEVLTSAQMTHIQNELLKAIDGVNGGTYTLASPLQFAGADVRIAADLEVISGGEINIQNGGALNVLAGGLIDFSGDLHISSGGELVVEPGGLLTLQNGASLDALGTVDVTGTGSIEVGAGGAININPGGDLNVSSADVTINSGAQILLNGGSLIIGATGAVQANGGDINLASGSQIIGAAGAGVQVQDAEDLVVNGSNEQWLLTLTPTIIQHDGGNLPTWSALPEGGGTFGWYQNNVTTARPIWFALPFLPGDSIVNIFVRVDGNANNVAHGALPAVMPQIELWSVDINGVFTSLQTAVDGSASQAAYDAPHNILLSGGVFPFTVGANRLYVCVRGETGANSQLGLGILSISGNLTARAYRSALAVYS